MDGNLCYFLSGMVTVLRISAISVLRMYLLVCCIVFSCTNDNHEGMLLVSLSGTCLECFSVTLTEHFGRPYVLRLFGDCCHHSADAGLQAPNNQTVINAF